MKDIHTENTTLFFKNQVCPLKSHFCSICLKRAMPPHPFSYFPSDHVLFPIMFYVYILKSKKDEKLYVGSTNDLRRRLSEHNAKLVISTKGRAPFELRYYESFFSDEDARKREWSLKKDGNALAQLKKRISESLL